MNYHAPHKKAAAQNGAFGEHDRPKPDQNAAFQPQSTNAPSKAAAGALDRS